MIGLRPSVSPCRGYVDEKLKSFATINIVIDCTVWTQPGYAAETPLLRIASPRSRRLGFSPLAHAGYLHVEVRCTSWLHSKRCRSHPIDLTGCQIGSLTGHQCKLSHQKTQVTSRSSLVHRQFASWSHRAEIGQSIGNCEASISLYALFPMAWVLFCTGRTVVFSVLVCTDF